VQVDCGSPYGQVEFLVTSFDPKRCRHHLAYDPEEKKGLYRPDFSRLEPERSPWSRWGVELHKHFAGFARHGADANVTACREAQGLEIDEWHSGRCWDV